MISLLASIWNHPANRHRRWRALARAAHWQVHQRVIRAPLDIPYHGFRLRCPPHNHSGSRAIYFAAMPDHAEMTFMTHYLRPGDRFIDAGANLGLYTLLARSIVGPDGQIDAFEPNTRAAALLRENLALNEITNVSIHPSGLAEKNGSAAFQPGEDDCLGHVVTGNLPADATRIPVGRLDSLLSDVPYAMAKFDIEGYEPFAIRGMGDWLTRANPPVMLVEMGGYSNRHGIPTDAFVAELRELGYRCARYDPGSRELVDDPRPWETPGDNVLVLAESRLSAIRARVAP